MHYPQYLKNGLLGLTFLSVSGLVRAAVPPGTEVLQINDIGGKESPVTFPHGKHPGQFKKKNGTVVACLDCHHLITKGDKAIRAQGRCTGCHVREGLEQKPIGGKTPPFLTRSTPDKSGYVWNLYHETCRDTCHQQVRSKEKDITACQTCHKKK
jgi:hypothetical protein